MSRCTDEGHCITCGDTATPMVVVDAAPGTGLALCREPEGEPTLVDVTLVDDLSAGERVLVHAGVALTRVDQVEAA